MTAWRAMTEKATPSDDRNAKLRSLAAVDEVLREPAAQALLERYPRALVVDAVRTILERLRAEILEGGRRRARPTAMRPTRPAATPPRSPRPPSSPG